MKLERNSWHMHLVKSFSTNKWFDILDDGKVSLCSYFWTVAFAMLKLLSCVFILLAMVVIIFCVIATMFITPLIVLDLVSLSSLGITDEDVGGIVIIGTIGYLTVIIAMSNIYGDRIINWLQLKLSKTEPQKKESNSLIINYIKAKKQKVCPILHVEN
jgi:hypothetical protein